MRQLIAAVLHPQDYRWGLRPWRRHSLVVLVAGCVYIGIGITYFFAAPAESRQVSLALALWLMPLKGWGIAWALVGVLAVISSRWPPASETWGYSALAGLSSLWSAFYALGVLAGLIPGLDGAPWQSLSGAFVWALVAFLWWAIAGLWSPDPTLVRLSPTGSDPIAPPHIDEVP